MSVSSPSRARLAMESALAAQEEQNRAIQERQRQMRVEALICIHAKATERLALGYRIDPLTADIRELNSAALALKAAEDDPRRLAEMPATAKECCLHLAATGYYFAAAASLQLACRATSRLPRPELLISLGEDATTHLDMARRHLDRWTEQLEAEEVACAA